MRIALVQVSSPPDEEVARRRDRVGCMVLGAPPADLVALPELWGVGYFTFDRYEAEAETLEGPTVAAAREWARQRRCHVHLGSFVERSADGCLFNTAVLVDPSGAAVHTYRKVHVFGYHSLEATLLTPGTEVVTTATPFGELGATTCYDLRFPELWRRLADAGAETVVVPAAWPAVRRSHWEILTTCRALEEQVLLVACNAVGDQGGVALGGRSRVIDPWGEILGEAGDDEGATLVEADPSLVGKVRAEFPVLADRRLDVTGA